MSPPDSPIVAHERILRQVHALIDEGLGDSDEADKLADQLDATWYRMMPQEQDRMEALSIQLNRERDEREKNKP